MTKRKYEKHGIGEHIWGDQPFGRRKCLKCGHVQRQNNTLANRIARRKEREFRSMRAQKTSFRY